MNQNIYSACTSVTSQYADVRIPLKLKPHAAVGELQTECCGEPIITLRPSQNSNCCELCITQTICIRIPVIYCATAESGEAETVCRRNPACGSFGCR